MAEASTDTDVEIPCLNCLVCNRDISPVHNDYTEEKDLDEMMWSGGVVEKIHMGYGSKYDGDKFYLAICDTCIVSKWKSKQLIWAGNYMGFKMSSQFNPENAEIKSNSDVD